MELESLEAWLVVLIAVFSGFWQLLLVPFLPTFPFWLSLNPFFQYLVYNLGFILFSAFIIGGGAALFLKGEFNLVYALRSGIAIFLVFSLSFDLAQPPFAYNSCGDLIISNVSALGGASVDRMLGFLFESFLPFLGFARLEFFGFCLSLKYVVVYFLVPVIVLLLAALLLAGEDFVNLVMSRVQK